MSDGISWGEPGSELRLGGDEDDDGRGIGNDSEDIVTDFGRDLGWTGESIGDTTASAAGMLEHDTVGAIDSFGSDISGGHVIKAGEALVGGLWDDTGDVLEGVGMDVGEGAIGLGAAGLAVVDDGYDVIADAGTDALHGVEDLFGSGVVNDIGSAASDVGSALNTASTDVAEASGAAVTDVGDGAEDVVDDIGDGIEDVADDIGDLF